MSQFKKGQSGNPAGRPSGTKQSARKAGAAKMKKLLRALEPIADESIVVAAEIMQDEDAPHATRLKASVELLKKYIELTGEVYFEQLPKDEKESKGESDEDSDEDTEEHSQKGKLAMFSSQKK